MSFPDFFYLIKLNQTNMYLTIWIIILACAILTTTKSTTSDAAGPTTAIDVLTSITSVATTTKNPDTTMTKPDTTMQTIAATDSPTTRQPTKPTSISQAAETSRVPVATTTSKSTPRATTTISPLVLRTLQYDPDQKVGGGLCWPETPNVCHSNGLCIKDQHGAHSECHCFAQYGGFACETKQKSQLVAFLLALLLGWLGAGRFYLGYIALGIFKLLYHCVFAIIAAVNRAMLKEEQEPHPVIALFSCCCCCGWLIWWIHDVVVIGTGSLTAVDGIGMYLNL